MIWNCLGSRSFRANFPAGVIMFLPGTHLSFPAHILRGVDALSRLGHTLDASMDQLFVLGGKTALAVTMPRLQQLMQTQDEWQNRQIVQQAWYGGEVSQQVRCASFFRCAR
jgi:hypothetical protein